MGTTSPDVVKAKSCVTPHSKRLTDHSTPIRNKVDSPEINYIESPINEPLTQHPPSEVGWDYRHSLKNSEDGNAQNNMDSCTPKRSTNYLLSKKRNSNSPLLYKPVKKKLMQEKQREQQNMENFLSVLKQIESKAKQRKDNDEVSKKTDSSAESQLDIDMEVVSDDSDMKLQVSANTNESPGQGKNEKVQVKSHNALLDDSIEEMMVLCSQEIDPKEFGVKENQKIPVLCTIPENSSETSGNKSSKENIQPSNSIERLINISDVSSKNSSKSNKSESFPDDSFDDCFAEINDKEILLNDKIQKVVVHNKPSSVTIGNTVPKSSESQKKFFQSRGSALDKKNETAINSNYVKNCIPNDKVFKQTKVVNENASYGYLNKDYVRNGNSSISNVAAQNSISNDSRLLKAKSFSDSNFLQHSHQSQTFDRSRSNLNINQTNYQKQNKNSEGYGSSSLSYENKGWRRTNSSSSITYSQYSSVNRLTNSEGSQSTSTPAEIERKRQEAIARRQKKMNNGTSQSRPLQLPIKR